MHFISFLGISMMQIFETDIQRKEELNYKAESRVFLKRFNFPFSAHNQYHTASGIILCMCPATRDDATI